ncbi:chemotaxis signal transduction protein [Beggiatoa alba B18LD]|uniref:Chemotaxis signal transduction protein n=1 Tax=Beggiatoa alba B18LD TaxID=395493 RepID=I3CJF7_9GAMM|nr:chemotaxis protein CheW [Beggiatoa alba]EIJ43750.1 chemotaxis signal transduction protein [Beggiatoa alba B18LD]
MSLNENVVRSLLIPISSGNFLLPSTLVAEVTPYTNPTPVAETQPDWLLGTVLWREQKVPVLSINTALSLPAIDLSENYRIVVLYGLEAPQMLPFYAFLATDIPQALSIKPENLLNPYEEKRKGLVYGIQLADNERLESAWLPDVAYLEGLIKKSLPLLLAR